MNRTLIALSLVLAAPVALAAQAADSRAAEPPTDALLRQAPASELERRDGTPLAERACRQQTGSRIVRVESKGCISGNGRSYGRRDLASTGATDTGRALELLDPAIRGR